MSLPIALGAKSVSSRPLIGSSSSSLQDNNEHFAQDGTNRLTSIKIPGSVPLTATTICPLQEWMAFVTVEYFDRLMAVDNNNPAEAHDNIQRDPIKIQSPSSGGRRRLARHSTVAELRIQISPLGQPFSSAYQTTIHRLTLPSADAFRTGYLDEDHVEQISDQPPVQPSLIFSSDRRRLACLVPYPRAPQSALVAVDIKRPPRPAQPRPRPKVPAYIPTPTEPKPTRRIPQAQSEPQLLSLPTGGTALDIQHSARYWLHNITSICNASMQSNGKGSSVLLAGCRDGSILGISFQPLLLVGRLYHPSDPISQQSITFLSHITSTPTTSTTTDDSTNDQGISGRLVAIEESGTALIFQTRMILSSLAGEDLERSMNQFNMSISNLDDSTTNFNMDATDYSATGAGKVIHGESFNVVKAGRRHSLPANSRLAEESQPLLYPNPNPTSPNNHSPLGNTGLLMLLEPLSEYPGRFCRGEWIGGALLALLQTPLSSLPRKFNSDDSHSRHRVAQVLGVLPGQPPEVLTELTLSSDDLQEHAHTTFSLDDSDADNDDNLLSILPANSSFLSRTSALEATLGIQHDPHTGCLAISSVRRMDAFTPKNDSASRHSSQTRVFVCIWNWRSNVSGFIAVATSSSSQRPISRFFFAKETQTNVRRLTHLSAGGNGEISRLRKDLYEMGTLSPSQDVRSNCGLELHLASPTLLTAKSVLFASVTQPSSNTTEVEWQECTIPISYRLQYGSPSVAAMSSSGQSIAVASSRGLCVLECTPRAKKFSVGKDREYMRGEAQQPTTIPEGVMNRRGYMLPPKWHFFGNETEEKAFRVLTMAWWKGNADSKRSHASDDLLVAVIQMQRQEDGNSDPPGTCYLACWSQRRLDAAHQRLRPLDDNLRSSRGQWGVRLPDDFRAKSLNLLEQPLPCSGSTRQERQRERKATVLVASVAGLKGTVDYLAFQFQAIPSVGRTQSSESYQEHNPFSVLSKQCASGHIECPVDGSSVASVFLASASFQFDLRQRGSKFSAFNSPATEPNEIIGAVGVLRTPGCGLEAVALTSAGSSRSAAMLGSHAKGNKVSTGRSDMKASEISSYWLSDIILGQRPISTEFGGRAKIDFFVWTFQVANGKVYSWFVPCLEFMHDSASGPYPENAFSSRVMLGLICPLGSSTTWFRPSPTKTGGDFMTGCMPQSAHGCVLGSGQASRKFHRTIAGDFDHSLFAPDFLEHEFLSPRDFELSPPAFISSIAALLRCEAFLVSLRNAPNEKIVRAQNPGRCPTNAGGDDVVKAVLAVNVAAQTQARSILYQDAAFMACRIILLRTTEQLTEDTRKQQNGGSVDNPPLSARVLSNLIAVIKTCSSGRLQFASLILEVGRQLEPSCFPYLFPLPVVHQDQTTEGGKPAANGVAESFNWNGLRTVNDVFRACLEDGSLLCSVSTLPIIPGSSLSRDNSMLLLEHCLGVFNKNSNLEAELFFDFSIEERSMLRDIFRFGSKLEDSGKLDGHVSEDDDEESVASPSDSSQSSYEEMVEYGSKRKSYSLACGMLNLSWFRSKPNPSQQNLAARREEQPGEKKKHPKGRDSLEAQKENMAAQGGSEAGNVADSVAALVVKLAIPDNDELARAYAWKRSSALAFLLLGQDESLLPKASANHCTRLARSAVGLQDSGVETRLAELMTRCMVSCSTEIGTVAAGKLLDLILVILMRHSSRLDANLPGLLVIGVTAAFVSGRINEILDGENRSSPFSRCYWIAKEKTESLHAF